jgi:glutathione S-transferase
MKLYYSKGACSLAVRIVINELQLACEYEAVALKTHETESGKNYYEINPKGAVPALIHDNHLLTENNVIQQFLADTFDHAGALLPKAGISRYQTLEWMNYVCTDLHKSCSPIFNASLPDSIKDEIFRPILLKKLTYADKHLANSRYLTGESFHLPDAYLFVVLRWLPVLKINRQDFPNLEAFYQNVSKRSSVIKSLQEEQLSI